MFNDAVDDDREVSDEEDSKSLYIVPSLLTFPKWRDSICRVGDERVCLSFSMNRGVSG